nr:PEP-CTERM sorting domain-containing protein [Rhodovulum marinum]
MDMIRTVVLASAGLFLLCGSVAQAATVSITQTVTGTNGFANDLTFAFAGLAPSDGIGGVLTIATGPALDAPDFSGLDVTGPGEFFTLRADGEVLGSYTCAADATEETNPQRIPGGAVNADDTDCTFSLNLALPGGLLDTLLADGATVVEMLFSDIVDDFGDGDTVTATLSYTEASAPEIIPLPATASMLLGGLGLMGALRRRDRRARH